MRTYTGPSVLVIDELGYLPMDATSAHWIFQVVPRRYEHGSIVLTSNRGFGDWGQVFAHQVVATAILNGTRTSVSIRQSKPAKTMTSTAARRRYQSNSEVPVPANGMAATRSG